MRLRACHAQDMVKSTMEASRNTALSRRKGAFLQIALTTKCSTKQTAYNHATSIVRRNFSYIVE